MNSHEIKVSSDNDEGQSFVDWLNKNGHTAELSNTTGNYVDNVLTDTSPETNTIMNALWDEYCGS